MGMGLVTSGMGPIVLRQSLVSWNPVVDSMGELSWNITMGDVTCAPCNYHTDYSEFKNHTEEEKTILTTYSSPYRVPGGDGFICKKKIRRTNAPYCSQSF